MNDSQKNVDNINKLVYDGCITTIGGATMPANELIAAALKATNKTQAAAAASVGWVPQQLSGKLVRRSLRADEFLELLDAIGVEITLTVKETGKQVKEHIPGAGRRVKAMVDRVIYDTATADALSNNFYADGENQYTDGKARELYIDNEGRYFFAEYSSWEGAKDRITPVSASDAAVFIQKHGTEINKQPKTE